MQAVKAPGLLTTMLGKRVLFVRPFHESEYDERGQRQDTCQYTGKEGRIVACGLHTNPKGTSMVVVFTVNPDHPRLPMVTVCASHLKPVPEVKVKPGAPEAAFDHG